MIDQKQVEDAFYEHYPLKREEYCVEHRFAFEWRKDAFQEGVEWALEMLLKEKPKKRPEGDVLSGQLKLFEES